MRQHREVRRILYIRRRRIYRLREAPYEQFQVLIYRFRVLYQREYHVRHPQP